MWIDFETKLVDWEKRFASIWLKRTQEYLDTDREYISRELPLLKEEKRACEIRLSKLEELIAKTRILIDDLNEELCSELSGGHSLAAVGEALLSEFTKQLKEYYSKGRRTILEFLEKRYKISKAASKALFFLLEEVGTLYYRVDISNNLKNVPLAYYGSADGFYPEAAPDMIYQSDGWWEIRA